MMNFVTGLTESKVVRRVCAWSGFLRFLFFLNSEGLVHHWKVRKSDHLLFYAEMSQTKARCSTRCPATVVHQTGKQYGSVHTLIHTPGSDQ